jgi:hypothetical protein
MRNIEMNCKVFFNVRNSEQYRLSDFTFENLRVKADEKTEIGEEYISGCVVKNVRVDSLSKD